MIVTFIIYLINIYLMNIWIDFNLLLINELEKCTLTGITDLNKLTHIYKRHEEISTPMELLSLWGMECVDAEEDLHSFITYLLIYIIA